MKGEKFANWGNWLAFNALVAILIYGIVMFSNTTNCVNHTVVHLFMDGNPMPTLLADTYHSIHSVYETRGTIVCCLPLLCKWFTSHLPVNGPFVEARDAYLFYQRIMSLTSHDIEWYNPKMDTSEIIVKCRKFSNLPLIKEGVASIITPCFLFDR